MMKFFTSFLFSIFLVFSCSPEDEPEEELIADAQYLISLHQDCNASIEIADTFEVAEDVYFSISGRREVNNCETFFTIPDVEGEIHEGYLIGWEAVEGN